DYPIRLAVFDAGEHATAVRLTDWVQVLNWMLPGNEPDSNPVTRAGAAELGLSDPPCRLRRRRARHGGSSDRLGSGAQLDAPRKRARQQPGHARGSRRARTIRSALPSSTPASTPRRFV